MATPITITDTFGAKHQIDPDLIRVLDTGGIIFDPNDKPDANGARKGTFTDGRVILAGGENHPLKAIEASRIFKIVYP